MMHNMQRIVKGNSLSLQVPVVLECFEKHSGNPKIQIPNYARLKYLILHRYGMSIMFMWMGKTFKKIHKALCYGVRESSIYIMHLHLPVPVHFRKILIDNLQGSTQYPSILNETLNKI